MLISDQFEQVWTFGCGNITEYTEIDLLIHTCVHKQHFNPRWEDQNHNQEKSTLLLEDMHHHYYTDFFVTFQDIH
jgi:hypothetical protein